MEAPPREHEEDGREEQAQGREGVGDVDLMHAQPIRGRQGSPCNAYTRTSSSIFAAIASTLGSTASSSTGW